LVRQIRGIAELLDLLMITNKKNIIFETSSQIFNKIQAESIDKFHDQQSLLRLMEEAGFKFSTYKNLSFGISAIHSGFKI